jgi:hypothetical protein
MASALPHLTLGLQADVIIGSAPGGITEKATCISPILENCCKTSKVANLAVEYWRGMLCKTEMERGCGEHQRPVCRRGVGP